MTVRPDRVVSQAALLRNGRFWDAAAIAVVLGVAVVFAWMAFVPAVDRVKEPVKSPKPSVEKEKVREQVAVRVSVIYLPPPPPAVAVPSGAPQPQPVARKAPVPKDVEKVSRPEEPSSTTPSPPPSVRVEVQTQPPNPRVPPEASGKSATEDEPTSLENPIRKEPETSHERISVTRADVTEGRVRLRLLEKGKGPTMEIAWPETASERQALYDVFLQCLAMRPAILTAGERLYGLEGAPGRALSLSPDRVSFFMRRPEGRLAAREREALAHIRERHALSGGTPVRLMNRQVDAAILGGMAQVLGSKFDSARWIHARYELSGDTLLVREITADGQSYSSDIAIPTSMLRRC